ncbi:MAG: hypothetical protein H0W66_03565 [Chthoniobacterales bacterium]|nr:hypothetical protein [Chthoniobacterales bacterium]
MVLATALAGKAVVIVTGDDDLLVLQKFRGHSDSFAAPVSRTFGPSLDRNRRAGSWEEVGSQTPKVFASRRLK